MTVFYEQRTDVNTFPCFYGFIAAGAGEKRGLLLERRVYPDIPMTDAAADSDYTFHQGISVQEGTPS